MHLQQISIIWLLIMVDMMRCTKISERRPSERQNLQNVDRVHRIKKKSVNEDDMKTLSQQISEGKYGLIDKELFSNPIERPGIISYATNEELPNDNRVTLGGLKKNEIWLSKDNLLIIRGGGLAPENSPQKTVWSPINDYEAPKHEILLAENPEIPPPFPVQFYDQGPLIYFKKNVTNETQDVLKPINLNENELQFLKPINFNGTKNQSIDKTENNFDDDPSVYYPKKYSFHFKNKFETLVPPGPIVPGIILPPPPDFFGPLYASSSPQPPTQSILPLIKRLPTTIDVTSFVPKQTTMAAPTTLFSSTPSTPLSPTSSLSASGSTSSTPVDEPTSTTRRMIISTENTKTTTKTTTESLNQIYPTYYPTKATLKSLSDDKRKFYDFIDNSIQQESSTKSIRSSKNQNHNRTFILTINDYNSNRKNVTHSQSTIRPNSVDYPLKSFIESTTKHFYKKRNYPKVKKLNSKTEPPLTTVFVVREPFLVNDNRDDAVVPFQNYILVPLQDNFDYFNENIRNLKSQLKSHLNRAKIQNNLNSYQNYDSKPVYQYSFDSMNYRHEQTSSEPKDHQFTYLQPNKINYGQSSGDRDQLFRKPLLEKPINSLNVHNSHYHRNQQPHTQYEPEHHYVQPQTQPQLQPQLRRPDHHDQHHHTNTFQDNYFEHIFGQKLESDRKPKYNHYYNDKLVTFRNSLNSDFETKNHQSEENFRPIHNDIAVNFKNPRPSINPDAELVDTNLFQGTKISYQLPGNGAHVYFYTPYRKPNQFNLLQRRQSFQK